MIGRLLRSAPFQQAAVAIVRRSEYLRAQARPGETAGSVLLRTLSAVADPTNDAKHGAMLGLPKGATHEQIVAAVATLTPELASSSAHLGQALAQLREAETEDALYLRALDRDGREGADDEPAWRVPTDEQERRATVERLVNATEGDERGETYDAGSALAADLAISMWSLGRGPRVQIGSRGAEAWEREGTPQDRTRVVHEAASRRAEVERAFAESERREAAIARTEDDAETLGTAAHDFVTNGDEQ